MTELLDQQIHQWRQRLQLLMTSLAHFIGQGENEDLQRTVQDLMHRSADPFLFVIVGEVKAGKSSFINALLDTGTEICKVAPQPMTDCIQQIIYGETEEQTQINPYLRIVKQPVDILKDFAIVDTPGTNTIVQHHQEITERFIPASDLIVFVFEAKNPYRQSSWEFLSFIRDDWRKKILFVLQQKDLLTDEELRINTAGVHQHAVDQGIVDPVVFSVSARDEINGHKDISGFGPLREHIQSTVTGGKAPLLKMESILLTAETLLDKMDMGIVDRKNQWESDKAFRIRIGEALDQQGLLSQNQVHTLIDAITRDFHRITTTFGVELSEGLSFLTVINKTIAGIFSKQATLKEWLQDLIRRLEHALQTDLRMKLDQQIVDVADRIQQMARVIEYEIRNSPNELSLDHEIFSDIAERRAQVLRELLASFTSFLQRGENFMPDDVFDASKNMAPQVAAGSGIAVIGVVLAAVTKGMVFDITGGILTGLGVLFAGITFGFQRRSILRKYKNEMAQGESQLHQELESKLLSYIQTIRQRIESNFDRFDLHLQREEKDILRLENDLKQIRNNRQNLLLELQNSLV
ncbi:MAG: dynamin family protein [Saprospiraceae bacterium]|nr:dynamin family protein [Saprospiraceae bacterium]